MATFVHTIRTVTDDLTGAKGAEPVLFGLDGKTYKVDLTLGNRRALEKVLARYIRVAQEQKSADQVASRSQIRVWARENGFVVGDKGRISSEIMDAYFTANPVEESEDDSDLIASL